MSDSENEKALKILQSQNRAFLQRSISATLNEKIEKLRDVEREVLELRHCLKDLQNDDILNGSDYQNDRIKELKQKYTQMEEQYINLFGNLRVIGEQLVVMN